MRTIKSKADSSTSHNASDKVGPRRTRIVPVVKQWDEKAGVYTFNAKGKEVIVPVLADK